MSRRSKYSKDPNLQLSRPLQLRTFWLGRGSLMPSTRLISRKLKKRLRLRFQEKNGSWVNMERLSNQRKSNRNRKNKRRLSREKRSIMNSLMLDHLAMNE